MRGGGGSKLGWPLANTVRRFGPRSHPNFFFYGPPNQWWGPRSYLQLSNIPPPPSMGPHRWLWANQDLPTKEQKVQKDAFWGPISPTNRASAVLHGLWIHFP